MSWRDTFPWESDDQRLGFLAFEKWLRDNHKATLVDEPSLLKCIVAFFIQKDHESNEWWRDTVADQVKSLEMQILALRTELREIRGRVDGNS